MMSAPVEINDQPAQPRSATTRAIIDPKFGRVESIIGSPEEADRAAAMGWHLVEVDGVVHVDDVVALGEDGVYRKVVIKAFPFMIRKFNPALLARLRDFAREKRLPMPAAAMMLIEAGLDAKSARAAGAHAVNASRTPEERSAAASLASRARKRFGGPEKRQR